MFGQTNKLTLCEELALIEKKEADEGLKKLGLNILKTIRRKSFSRVEWMKKRQEEIADLTHLHNQLELAYLRGDKSTMLKIERELENYIEATGIKKRMGNYDGKDFRIVIEVE